MAWIPPPGPIAPGLTIGLLGGSFDPAHEGHLYLSRTVLEALGLDYVWWLVSPGNPLKAAPADLVWRMKSARAVARHPRIVVTDIERRLNTRYTVDTVAALQRRFPQVRFVWLMGSDNLAGFHRWHNWQALARRLPIVVVRRPGSVLATLSAPLARRFGTLSRLGPPPAILVLDGHRCPQSSTRLRAGFGVSPDAMLNPLL